MKILFSCDEYSPIKSGGIGTVTKIIAEELVSRGHVVHIVSGILPNYDVPEYEIMNGVIIHRFKYFQKFSFIFRKAGNGKESIIAKFLNKIDFLSILAKKEFFRTHEIIKNLIEKEEIDIVEFPDYLKISDYYRSKVRLTFPKYDVPVVARVHGCQSFAQYYRDGKIDDINHYNDASFFNSVNRIVAVSRFSADFLKDQLGIKKDIGVIYNPLNIDLLQKSNDTFPEEDNNEKNIVFLGKIVETKGAFNLIRAFNIFSMSHSEYRLIMIGGGNIELGKSIVNPLIKDKVCFTGYVNREQVHNYLSNATFCVVPSYFENFSMVALEIMAFGKALIYTKEASGKEIIEDGYDGILINPRNISEINAKMELLSEDESLRNKLGENASKKIRENFTVGRIVTELENYYQNTIATYE